MIHKVKSNLLIYKLKCVITKKCFCTNYTYFLLSKISSPKPLHNNNYNKPKVGNALALYVVHM